MFFVCPKCKKPLTKKIGCAVCSDGHSYDESKYGYYNFLLSQVGGVHGDNKEMVEARRSFLEGGYYSPLAEAVTELVIKHTRSGGQILDAGCGEGYYTERIHRAVTERDGEPHIAIFDISKEAVRRAKRRIPTAEACVASCYSMPIADGSLDTVVNIFSPLAEGEVHRVLKPEGKFIVAVPDAEHLFGLKSVLYETPYKNVIQEKAPEGFSEVERVRVRYTITLDTKEAIHSLFMMTPYAYRTNEAGRRRLDAMESLVTEADFTVFVYQRK